MTGSEVDSVYINKILSSRGMNVGHLSKDPKFVSWLKNKTPLLQDGKHTLATMAYWALNGITDYPPCQYADRFSSCANGFDMRMHGNVRSVRDGYVGSCCRECKHMLSERSTKTRKTCMSRYGVGCALETDTAVANREKWLDAHGVDNPFQDDGVKLKSERSRLAKFGFAYTMQSPDKRALASRRYLEKTGYRHQFENPAVRDKIKSSLSDIDNDGVNARRSISMRRRFYDSLESCDVKPLFDFREFSTVDKREYRSRKFRWKCDRCGNVFESVIDYNYISRFGSPARCEICHPYSDCGTSYEENAFFEFVTGLGEFDVVRMDRTTISPYELDVVVPSRHIAFEFDGLYWHSDLFRDKSYHLNKTDMCNKVGVRLVHVFEDEWINKGEIVRSRIRDMFGVYSDVVYARNCNVVTLCDGVSMEFLEKNHLQGRIHSAVSIGLEYLGQIISVMTFGKSRFDVNHEWEMFRFCNRIGYHIPGAASRLLAHFERRFHPVSIVSYADRRWSDGNLYRKLGFDMVSVSKPGYFYVKNQTRFSRMGFQKHMLENKLSVFDPTLTEYENMAANGYMRVWDCGNFVFGKTYG